MKLYKKILTVLLSVSLIFFISGIQVSAANIEQDGLEVKLTTDKDKYSIGQPIAVTLTVKNTNDYALKNVMLQNAVPNGYKLSNESVLTKQVETLEKDSIVYLKTTYINSVETGTEKSTEKSTEKGTEKSTETYTEENTQKQTEVINAVSTESNDTLKRSGASIDTGDIFKIFGICFSVIVAALILIFVALKKKKGKQLLSLMLISSILFCYFSIAPNNVLAAETNKVINIHESVKVENISVIIESVVHYQSENDDSNSYYTVTFETSGGTEVESQTIEAGGYAVKPEMPQKDGYFFAGWYSDSQFSNYFLFDEPVSRSLTLYAKWIGDNDTTDTDGDGIYDFIEDYIGTDKNKADTDGDGISDYIEIMVLATNPLEKDSNNDGLEDGEEDSDGDGLTNLEEISSGTSPLYKDTDDDGLSDYDEVKKYRTDPLSEDTDRDFMSDPTEIKLGLNPLSADTDGNGVIDSQETLTMNIDIAEEKSFDISKAGVVPSVRITGSGDYYKMLYADVSSNETITDIPFIVGSPYEFVHTDDFAFDSCVLTFKLSDDVLTENNITDLMIAWYDDENNTVNPITTSYDEANKEIYADVEHFSSYIVINKKAYASSFGVLSNIIISDEISAKINTYNGHYYAVIDESMPWTEAKDYCSALGGHLVTIQSQSEQNFISGLIENADKNTYWIGLTGEDNHYSWITGEPLKYNNWSDGEPNTLTETVVHMYAKVQSIYLGKWNDTFNAYSGDDYYSYRNCGIICEWESNPQTSSDDGKCFVLLSNGTSVCLNKDPSLGDRTVDTDGDGICDIDELGGRFSMEIFDPYARISQNTSVAVIYTWKFKSNPGKADTDGDGENDNTDLSPTKYLVYENLLYYIKKLENIAKSECNNNRSGCSAGQENWLIAMYLRHFNQSYCSANWDMTGGKLNNEFIELIENEYPEINNFFIEHNIVTSNFGELDVYHLGATLCGYLYETSFSDGSDLRNKIIAGLMPERCINDLSGWAGDLQSLCVDIYEQNYWDKDTVKDISYEYVYQHVYDSLSGAKNMTRFSLRDLNSDIDAMLLYKICKNDKMLYESMEYYYGNQYRTRYKDFYENIALTYYRNDHMTGIDIFNDDIYFTMAVKDYLSEKFLLFIEWPILRQSQNNIDIYCKPTPNMQNGICYAFIDCIREHF